MKAVLLSKTKCYVNELSHLVYIDPNTKCTIVFCYHSMLQEFGARPNIRFPETNEMKPNIHERLSLETEDSHAWMFVQDWHRCSVVSVTRSYFIESCECCYSYKKSISIVVYKYQFSLGTNWNTDWNYRNICMADTCDHCVDMCCSAIEASGWRHKRPSEFRELPQKSGKGVSSLLQSFVIKMLQKCTI